MVRDSVVSLTYHLTRNHQHRFYFSPFIGYSVTDGISEGLFVENLVGGVSRAVFEQIFTPSPSRRIGFLFSGTDPAQYSIYGNRTTAPILVRGRILMQLFTLV